MSAKRIVPGGCYVMKPNPRKWNPNRFICALCGASFLLFAVMDAHAGPSGSGEVLVVLKNPSADRITRTSLSRGAARSRVSIAASSVGAEVEQIYPALSEASGHVFALLRSGTRSAEQMERALKSRADVLAVMPNRPVRQLAVPDDADFDKLWGMKAIRAPEAWEIVSGDAMVHVAVIDSGIDREHEDLKGNVDLSRSLNFHTTSEDRSNYGDGTGHGTHVAGTIGAVGNNGLGVAGVAWRTRLIALRVFNNEGDSTARHTVEALDRLAGILMDEPELKLAAVNISAGVYQEETPEEMVGKPMWRAYKALDDMNRTVFVVAAGNDGCEVGKPIPGVLPSGRPAGDLEGKYEYPASFIGLKNLIVVGAMARDGEASDNSSWSETLVDLAAPGEGIWSTTPKGVLDRSTNLPHGKYGSKSGTSMAAPHVSGAAALLLSRYPFLKADEVKKALLEGANPSKNPLVGGKNFSRRGLLDVKNSLDWLRREHFGVDPDPSLKPSPRPAPQPDPKPKPNPTPPPTLRPSPEPDVDSRLTISARASDWMLTTTDLEGGVKDIEASTRITLSSTKGKILLPDRLTVFVRGFLEKPTAEVLAGGRPSGIPVEVEARRATGASAGDDYILRIRGRAAESGIKDAAVEGLVYSVGGVDKSVDLRTEENLGAGVCLSGMKGSTPAPEAPGRPSKSSSGGCDAGLGGLLLLFVSCLGVGVRGKRRSLHRRGKSS